MCTLIPVSAWECLRSEHPKWTSPGSGSRCVPGSVPGVRDKEMNRIGDLPSRGRLFVGKTKLLCDLL